MQIDWLTVIAQILNFLILVWLLKRFLYQPVINAMERREQLIAGRLDEADQSQQMAAETKQEYQDRIEALERERGELLEKARLEVESERRELLDEARKEVTEKSTHWQQQVTQEKQDFLRSLKYQATESIQAIARRALADLADTELEEQIIHSFMRRLESLDQASLQAMASASGPLKLTTSFALDPAIREQLNHAVRIKFGEQSEVVFGESRTLLCGIELTRGGRRLSWSLADYLEMLEQRIQGQLETSSGSNR